MDGRRAESTLLHGPMRRLRRDNIVESLSCCQQTLHASVIRSGDVTKRVCGETCLIGGETY